ncbi:MAG: acyl-CoA thioester hydrolase [Actinomycetota bacterium]|jgi:acyl-CoA thioester hydrolase|nr:acyl-CoA thioester hydrolase [Actinomycetota bacterium]
MHGTDSPRTELPAPEDFNVLRRLPTRWGDNDVYGHLNNAVYYSLFDTAVNGWLLDATGQDIRQLPAIGVVVETTCRYLQELSFPDVALVGVALERLGRTSVVYRLAVFIEQDDGRAGQRAHAVGRFVHVYVDAQTRRPTPVPALVAEALARLEQK